jgi:hypothetical protein
LYPSVRRRDPAAPLKFPAKKPVPGDDFAAAELPYTASVIRGFCVFRLKAEATAGNGHRGFRLQAEEVGKISGGFV